MPPPPARPTRSFPYSIPRVICSNEAIVPSTDRRSSFEVVNGRCLNCCRTVTSLGHTHDAPPRVFGTKDEMDAFVNAHWIEDDEGGDGVL